MTDAIKHTHTHTHTHTQQQQQQQQRKQSCAYFDVTELKENI